MHGFEMTVQVSAKLNRSHAVARHPEARSLPFWSPRSTSSRDHQFVSVEDSVCAVHGSHGGSAPVAPQPAVEISIITRLARAVLAIPLCPWTGRAGFHDLPIPRPHQPCCFPASRVQCAGTAQGRLHPADGPRDAHSRTFATNAGKAMLTVSEVGGAGRPTGRLITYRRPCAHTTSSTPPSTA
jgi:formate dehydrogenase major subunit